MNIVLAHGVLGAHIFLGKPYFNGVKKHLEDRFGANVMESDAKAIATVSVRSKELRKQIVDHFGDAPGEKVIIIAHSMGGLDARLMLTDHPELALHVQSLTCIATPHHGSRVATLLNIANPLRLFGGFGEDLDAVNDLSEAGAKEIDAKCPDRPGIRYREVAGIGRNAKPHTANFFRITSPALDGLNDGVVALSSAVPPGRTLLETAPADHADLVGHDVDDFPDLRPLAFDHLPLYERIVRDAIA